MQTRETYRKLIAKSLVLLAVTLSDGDSVVIVLVVETIICNVSHAAKTTSSVQQTLKSSLNTGPHLDTSTVTGVGHGDVVDIQVLHDIRLAFVLTQRTNTDTV